MSHGPPLFGLAPGRHARQRRFPSLLFLCAYFRHIPAAVRGVWAGTAHLVSPYRRLEAIAVGWELGPRQLMLDFVFRTKSACLASLLPDAGQPVRRLVREQLYTYASVHLHHIAVRASQKELMEYITITARISSGNEAVLRLDADLSYPQISYNHCDPIVHTSLLSFLASLHKRC